MQRIPFLRFWFVAMLLLAPGWSQAQEPSTKVLGRIVVAKVVGEVTVTDLRDPMRPRKIAERDEIAEGQILNTGENARVLLVFSNGATINLAARSTLAIDEFLQDPFTQSVKVSDLTAEPTSSVTKLNLIRGELMSNVKPLRRDKGSSFSVQTPVGAAGIRGTTFQILYRPAGNVASFALRMVEGKIAMDFGALARPLDVEKDKQVAIDGIPLDAAGRVRSLPGIVQVSDIPAQIKAALALAQQQLLEAGASVTFPPMRNAEGPQQAYPQPSGGDAGSATPPTAGATTGEAMPYSPVPPPLAPAPRTTPGDGRL